MLLIIDTCYSLLVLPLILLADRREIEDIGKVKAGKLSTLLINKGEITKGNI